MYLLKKKKSKNPEEDSESKINMTARRKISSLKLKAIKNQKMISTSPKILRKRIFKDSKFRMTTTSRRKTKSFNRRKSQRNLKATSKSISSSRNKPNTQRKNHLKVNNNLKQSKPTSLTSSKNLKKSDLLHPSKAKVMTTKVSLMENCSCEECKLIKNCWNSKAILEPAKNS